MSAALLAPVPVLTLLLAVLVAALPWGGPVWLDLALELLPVGVITTWSLRRPRLLPFVAVFACGLLLDTLSHGPLGIWSAVFITAAYAGRLARRTRIEQSLLRRLITPPLIIAFAAALSIGLTSVYLWQSLDPVPMLASVGAAVAIYPVITWLLSAVDRLWSTSLDRASWLRGE